MRARRRRYGLITPMVAVLVFLIAAIFSIFTGEDYQEQSIILLLCLLVVAVGDLEDKADELLGDLPAKVLECPYGYGECEAYPVGFKPCGKEGPEVTQPLPKVSPRDRGSD